MTTVHHFRNLKVEKQKAVWVTAYDYTTAKVVASSEVDGILVGDSAAMVMHGHPSTVHATTEMMALHTAAVVRGAPGKFVVADLPFLTYRKDLRTAMDAVQSLMQAGASAVKLEGIRGHEEIVERIVGSGVPVMAHIGLTPQSIHGLGGMKVQGRDTETARELLDQALLLEKLGCFSIVLECVPSALGSEITNALSIPTVGIGAGPETDGQVLVIQDLLGMNSEFQPKFLRRFLDGHATILGALNDYAGQVRARSYPSEKESYS